jgi:hypothetical protein
MARKYTSISIETTLSSAISSTATTLTVASAANLIGDVTFGASDQFAIAIDPDTVSEEILFVTAANTSTNVLTVTRARAGTSGIAHAAGATVKHVLTGEDLTYFEAGVSAAITATSTSTLTNKTVALGSNTVSGTIAQFNTAVTDADFATIAGTETLTNKTLTTPTITTPTITNAISSIAINSQTAAYTLTSTDKSKMVIITSSSTANITVPSGVFSQGDIVYVARQGSGACSLTAASGVTITATPGLALRAQYSVGAILCTASNTFIATGDLSA